MRRRNSIRLQGFDYARQGAYFVTICTRNRECFLGDVEDGKMRLSDSGRLAMAVWEGLPSHYPHIQLDTYVIMPNNVHGIVVLEDKDDRHVGAGLKPAPTDANTDKVRHGLPEVVRAFKTFSARHINAFRGSVGLSVWQRNYYEHVIRSDESLNRIRQYIMDNPSRWHEDPENPNVFVKPYPNRPGKIEF